MAVVDDAPNVAEDHVVAREEVAGAVENGRRRAGGAQRGEVMVISVGLGPRGGWQADLVWTPDKDYRRRRKARGSPARGNRAGATSVHRRRSHAGAHGSPRLLGRIHHERPQERIVVITGASSGIGKAAALGFAQRGANLALAARQPALEAVAHACEQAGVRAIAVEADVTDAEAMERLAQEAIETFGGIDVWINNAGTGLFGAFPEGIAAHKRSWRRICSAP